ncbi:MAG: arylsulfate sulfotransferase N-terminal domain-containing protein, partial [Desulfovibrio sp.]|nr:arylsulfate sulfotransferase N-terminal domain-containing protein [Desulfovibrio sp.]
MANRVEHVRYDHLITRQNRAEKEFLARLENEKPRLDNAIVVVNPYLINPLAAMILFKSDKPAKAVLTVHGKRNDREDNVHEFPEATSHALPVLGLYEGMQTRVTVALSTGESQDFLIQSQPLPKG